MQNEETGADEWMNGLLDGEARTLNHQLF